MRGDGRAREAAPRCARSIRLLVRGVASYGLELFRAVPDLDVVYVPIGLGSGICGVIAAREALGRKTEIVGVVAANAPTYALSVAAGKPVATNSADTFAGGLAVRVPERRRSTDSPLGAARIVTVTEAEYAERCASLYRYPQRRRGCGCGGVRRGVAGALPAARQEGRGDPDRGATSTAPFSPRCWPSRTTTDRAGKRPLVSLG